MLCKLIVRILDITRHLQVQRNCNWQLYWLIEDFWNYIFSPFHSRILGLWRLVFSVSVSVSWFSKNVFIYHGIDMILLNMNAWTILSCFVFQPIKRTIFFLMRSNILLFKFFMQHEMLVYHVQLMSIIEKNRI